MLSYQYLKTLAKCLKTLTYIASPYLFPYLRDTFLLSPTCALVLESCALALEASAVLPCEKPCLTLNASRAASGMLFGDCVGSRHGALLCDVVTVGGVAIAV